MNKGRYLIVVEILLELGYIEVYENDTYLFFKKAGVVRPIQINKDKCEIHRIDSNHEFESEKPNIKLNVEDKGKNFSSQVQQPPFEGYSNVKIVDYSFPRRL